MNIMEKLCAGPRVTKEARSKKMHQELSNMDSLPREIALDILSRLPITSLIQIKWVCRSWRSLAQDPLLATMHLSRMNDNDPGLILHCDLPLQNHLYSLHLSAPDIVTRLRGPMISEFAIVGSCNGLLCLWHSLYKDKCYIYNPFTRDFKELPRPEQFQTQTRVAMGFGFHPGTKEYKVVRIVYYRNEDEASSFQVRRYLPESNVQVLTLGSGRSTWRSKGKTCYQILGSGRPYQSNVLLNGRLHWLTCRHRHQSLRLLVSFDLADEQFQEVPNPDGMFGRRCSHLAILRGYLSAIVQGFRRLSIWVMKEYGVKESWVKEFNIGDHLPRHMDLNQEQFIYIPEYPINCSQARVLCLLKNGEILLEYKRRSLFSCDLKSGAFRELVGGSLPESFSTIVHIGSLKLIN
ncbi:hypothetical protein GH714_020712 [Hevea brasiliensis]|uniref:F-box domain-containing protein n=1 Tax=Hevea brasiliensis TaxID=3981 RepID=A0A6A6KWG9_HEVBR|nr:hypothetical protein GH714_020712 [Hevea brasiliensis]